MPLPRDRAARLRTLRRRTAVGAAGLLAAAWIAVAGAGAKPATHATTTPAAPSTSTSQSTAPSTSPSTSGSSSTDDGSDAPLVTRQS
jgi:hypothetical protein